MLNQIQRGLLFQELHNRSSIFLMPNAWDAGSAMMLAAHGFPAVATTSAGIAFSLGFPDQEAAVSKTDMLKRVESIATTTQLPVNADLQSGYGANPEDVAQTITNAIATGIVGANIEDFCEHSAQSLYPIKEATQRIHAAKMAARSTGVPFVLTARTDAFLVGSDQPFAEAVKRCNAYREAGADCLFVPGAAEPAIIENLVKELDGPLTVVMGLTGSSMNIKQLESMGVRRVTIGGSLARATFGLIQQAAIEMATSGTFSYANQQIPDAKLSEFFAHQRQTQL
ncbi:MAG: isocitrate lyase/PEP mutase family protein [Formosimonas sp.]